MKFSIFAPQVLMDSIMSKLNNDARIRSVSTVLSDKNSIEKEIKGYSSAELQIQKTTSGNISTALIQTDFDWPHDADGIEAFKSFMCSVASLVSKTKIEPRFSELHKFSVKKHWTSIVLDVDSFYYAVKISNETAETKFLNSYKPVQLDKKYGMTNAFWLSFQAYLRGDTPLSFLTPGAAMKLGLMSQREYFIVRSFVPKDKPLDFSQSGLDKNLAKTATSQVKQEIVSEYKKVIRKIEFEVQKNAKIRQELTGFNYFCTDVVSLLQGKGNLPKAWKDEFIEPASTVQTETQARKLLSFFNTNIYPVLDQKDKTILDRHKAMLDSFVFLTSSENSIAVANWCNETKLNLQKTIFPSKFVYDDILTYTRQLPRLALDLKKELAFIDFGSKIEPLRATKTPDPATVLSLIKNALLPSYIRAQKDLIPGIDKIGDVLLRHFGANWQLKITPDALESKIFTKSKVTLLCGDLKKAMSEISFNMALSNPNTYLADKLEIEKPFSTSTDYYKKFSSAMRDIFVLEHISINGFPVGYEEVELSGRGLIRYIRPDLVSINSLTAIPKSTTMFDEYKKIFTSFESELMQKNNINLQGLMSKMFNLVNDYIGTHLKTPDEIVKFLEKTSIPDLNKIVSTLVRERFPEITPDIHLALEKKLKTDLRLDAVYGKRISDFVAYPYAGFFMVASTEKSLGIAKILANAQAPDRVMSVRPLVPPDQFHAIIDTVIQKHGVENVALNGLSGALGGFVDGEKIVVNDMHDDLIKLSSKLHELAHLVYHFNSTVAGFKLKTIDERLDMYKQWGITLRGTPVTDKNCHAVDELLAESLSTYMLAFYGYGQTHSYLKSYYKAIQVAMLTPEEKIELKNLPKDSRDAFIKEKNPLYFEDLAHLQRAFYHQATIFVKEIDRATKEITGKSRDQLYRETDDAPVKEIGIKPLPEQVTPETSLSLNNIPDNKNDQPVQTGNILASVIDDRDFN